MPKVKTKSGKTKHFPYTKKGMATAKKERMMMEKKQMMMKKKHR